MRLTCCSQNYGGLLACTKLQNHINMKKAAIVGRLQITFEWDDKLHLQKMTHHDLHNTTIPSMETLQLTLAVSVTSNC